MKVSFITKHAVSNYGSILQTYATQEIIKKIGHEPEIINYIRYDLRSNKIGNTLLKNQKKWNKNFLTKSIYKLIQVPNYILMDKRFQKFRNRLYDRTTMLYGSNEELTNNPPIADIYCAGSDQIWGKNGSEKIDKAYYLDFIKENGKCISYASSFGVETINEELKKNLYSLLNKYSQITVREESAVKILKENGINARSVLDPTLLLSANEWGKIAQNNKKEKKYILIYQLHSNKEFEKYAKKFSKKVGLPLKRITPSIHQLTRCGKKVFLPTPEQFIWYFKNAEYVITDSFHGTVFSIIFNRKLIDINPGETSTRIKNILSLVGLEERLIRDFNDFSLIDKKIAWNKVNEILEKERKKSIEIFENMINVNINTINDCVSDKCTGCRACEQLCSQKAIKMVENSEGFLYPKIDKEKCSKCGLCVKKCPQILENEIKNESKYYAVKIKDTNYQLESSSGGAFTAIAKQILNNNGVVYGAAFNEEFIVCHKKCENLEDLKEIRGSKYVQSDTQNSYKDVKMSLDKNVKVLYSGTPCQIAGLYAYLGKEYENLMTVDFVCHGVPSPKLFRKYKEWIEKKYKGKLIQYNFRNKEKNGWGLNSKITIKSKNHIKNKYHNAKLDPYYKSFLEGLTYRECCYKCKYANTNRIADFTIADFWGIEIYHPEFADSKGVSLLVVNTKKATEMFDKICNDIVYLKTTFKKASAKNNNLCFSCRRDKKRDRVYEDIENRSFLIYAQKSLGFKKEFKDIVKGMIPSKFKKIIKKIIKRK